jgi:hypothetical protein
MTESEQATAFVAFLTEQGYAPKIEGESIVAFMFEGNKYYILPSDDPEYFRLAYPNFWSIESPEEKLMAMMVASEVNGSVKVAKVYTVEENVWASTELFCDPLDNYKTVFKRSLRALRAAVERFAEGMKAETASEDNK